jgi:hypothetical protein
MYRSMLAPTFQVLGNFLEGTQNELPAMVCCVVGGQLLSRGIWAAAYGGP